MIADVLAGRASPQLEAGSRKMLQLLRRLVPSDAVLNDAELSVSFEGRPQARYGNFAEPLLADLLRCAGVARVDGPVVLGLPARGHDPACLIWVLPEAELELRIRAASLPIDEAFWLPPPRFGPFAVPERLPAFPGPPTYRTFAVPRTCPRCEVAGREFRELGEHFVCRSCGCSFPVDALR